MTDHNQHRDGDAKREGEAPAELLNEVPATRLRGSVALPGLASRLRGSVALPKKALPNTALAARRHPVHGIKHVDGQPTIIFDTLCTKDRLPVLAFDEFHSVFREVAAGATAWLVGRYVIMPDHIHFFAGDAGGGIAYEKWVTYLKSQITRALGGRGSCRAVAVDGDSAARREPRPPGPVAFRWLTDHWDSRVRSADAYEEKWRYFLNNPIRKGLVARPEEWPYQGEVFELRWG